MFPFFKKKQTKKYEVKNSIYQCIIEAGLGSPVVNNRGACAVLEAWQTAFNQSVAEFAPRIAEQIRNLLKLEVDENLKLRYDKLV